MSFSSALGRFLGKCCCPQCPPCPGRPSLHGWSARPIPGCPQCPDCPPCPDFPTQRGYSTSSGFINTCPKCPECADNPCYRSPIEEICPCIPTRFLVILSGVSIGCPCTIGSTGDPPNSHYKITTTSYDGAYCFPHAGPWGLPFPFTLYGPDSPTDDCDGATIVSTGVGAELSLEVSFGATGVNVDLLMTGSGAGAVSTASLIIEEHRDHLPCQGPWIINISPRPCGYDPVSGDYGPGTTGGTAIIYPCGC